MWHLNLVVALALSAMPCHGATAQKSVPASRPASSSNNPEELRRLADKGDVDAMFNLGVMYADGRGVAKDEKQAVQWYRKAAELGYPAAMFNLGWMYENGRGVAKDDKQAVECYRKAAELGHPNAMVNLGVMYANGSGVAEDDVLAYVWANLAGAHGAARGTELCDLLEKRMTGAQIEEAQRLSREWMDKHPKK